MEDISVKDKIKFIEDKNFTKIIQQDEKLL